MTENDFILHGNNARVDPKDPKQLNSSFQTLVNTNYQTSTDGTVGLINQDDVRFTKKAVDENDK